MDISCWIVGIDGDHIVLPLCPRPFPIFIHHVKEEGADPDVVIRLTTFYNLNVSLVEQLHRKSRKTFC